MINMASARVENICFQDKIPVILTTYLELETYIKGHLAYKEIWMPELGEQLNVPMEPDNRVDKFAVYVEKYQAVVGRLKKGGSEKFPKTIFYFLRSGTYSSFYAKFSGKKGNLKDGEGLQVPCKMIVKRQKK